MISVCAVPTLASHPAHIHRLYPRRISCGAWRSWLAYGQYRHLNRCLYSVTPPPLYSPYTAFDICGITCVCTNARSARHVDAMRNKSRDDTRSNINIRTSAVTFVNCSTRLLIMYERHLDITRLSFLPIHGVHLSMPDADLNRIHNQHMCADT